MIANSAFLAAMVLVLLVFSLMEQLAFLAPYKRLIVHRYLWTLVSILVVMFLNLFALFNVINRRLFLKDTGRKLAHVEQQLLTRDTIAHDLSDRLAKTIEESGERADIRGRAPHRVFAPGESLDPRVDFFQKLRKPPAGIDDGQLADVSKWICPAEKTPFGQFILDNQNRFVILDVGPSICSNRPA